jgi:hypothetical protein
MSNEMKFTNIEQQSLMVAGVCVPISECTGTGDYDALLREAIRVALRMDYESDDYDKLYDRIRDLMDAYLDSPEGQDPVRHLMARVVACIADVIPQSVRETLIANPGIHTDPQVIQRMHDSLFKGKLRTD